MWTQLHTDGDTVRVHYALPWLLDSYAGYSTHFPWDDLVYLGLYSSIHGEILLNGHVASANRANSLYISRGDPFNMWQHAETSEVYHSIYARQANSPAAYPLLVRLTQESAMEGARRWAIVRSRATLSPQAKRYIHSAHISGTCATNTLVDHDIRKSEHGPCRRPRYCSVLSAPAI